MPINAVSVPTLNQIEPQQVDSAEPADTDQHVARAGKPELERVLRTQEPSGREGGSQQHLEQTGGAESGDGSVPLSLGMHNALADVEYLLNRTPIERSGHGLRLSLTPEDHGAASVRLPGGATLRLSQSPGEGGQPGTVTGLRGAVFAAGQQAALDPELNAMLQAMPGSRTPGGQYYTDEAVLEALQSLLERRGHDGMSEAAIEDTSLKANVEQEGSGNAAG